MEKEWRGLIHKGINYSEYLEMSSDCEVRNVKNKKIRKIKTLSRWKYVNQKVDGNYIQINVDKAYDETFKNIKYITNKIENINENDWYDLIFDNINYGYKYKINKNAEVINIKKREYVKMSLNNFGYFSFYVEENNSYRILSLHRAMGFTFLDGYKDKLCINHKNGIKTDNSIENLEWVTRKYNVQHAWKTGLNGKNEEQIIKIKKSTRKFTMEQAMEIREEYKNSYISYTDLSEKYNVCKMTIMNIIKNRTYID